MRWLLDYAAQQSSGIAAWQRDTDHIEKAFVFGGMPARSGLTAALLVRAGWTGIDDVFSGPDNFILANAPSADPARLIEKLGERYEVTRTDIKKWSVGSPIQAPLDALEILHKRRPFEAGDVPKVLVRRRNPEAYVVPTRGVHDIYLRQLGAIMLIDKTVRSRRRKVPRMRTRGCASAPRSSLFPTRSLTAGSVRRSSRSRWRTAASLPSTPRRCAAAPTIRGRVMRSSPNAAT
jgi:hypothetical protein